MLVSGGLDNTVKIWNTENGQCLRSIKKDAQTIWSLAFSPDGQLLASGDENASVKLWDTQSWECIQNLKLSGPYEGLNIAGVPGLSEAQTVALHALGDISG